MKRPDGSLRKLLVMLSLLLCLALTAGNLVTGVWTADLSGKTVEAKKRKNKNKNNTSGNSQRTDTQDVKSSSQTTDGDEELLKEDGSYTSKEDVALYLHQYGKLPQNFITKEEARKLGWSSGSLENYAPGKCIGGSRFGNYEEKLPVKKGRTYYECDIDTLGAKSRGAKRIVYSDDGLIYYTGDHYVTFELLYGEETKKEEAHE